MAVIEHLALVSPTEGAAPSLPTGWANAGSATQLEVRAAAAFAPDSWGLRLPAVSTSFRRIEYTFSDGALTSGTRVWGFGINPTTFSASTTIIGSMVDGTTGKTEIRINTGSTTRTISLRNLANGNTIVTTTNTFATGTALWLEYGLTIGGNLELRIYNFSTKALIETLTLAATLITQVTKAYMGLNAAAASYAADYGLPYYANDWLTVAAAGTASLSLSATGAAAPGGNAAGGTAALSLSATGAGKAVVAGTGALTLSASGAATATAMFTFVPKYPVTAAHRGGFPNGEETFEAYDYSLARVPDVALEYDLQELSDGKFGLLHDATVDRTADASSPITTGSASSLTTAQFQSIITTPQDSGSGGVTGHARIMDEMATRYPTQLHLPEIKTGGNYTSAISQMIALGLGSHSIVQSFSYAAATAAAAAGLEVVYEMASGDSHTFSQMKADGINHVMRNKTLWTTPDITSAKAVGLKTWIFTVDTTTERDTWLANGIDGGFITGQPATVHMTAMGSGALTLSASGAAKGAGAGSASLSLSATGTASVVGAGTAALSLSATGAGKAPAAGTAALSLVGTGAATTPAAGSAALTLTATGTAGTLAAATGTASLSLSATGAAKATAAGTAALALTVTGATAAPAIGTASITLAATGTGVGPGQAAGSTTITLTASGAARATGAGTAAITLSGAGSPGAPAAGTAALTLFAAATAKAAAQGLAAITLTGVGGAGSTAGGSATIVLVGSGTATSGDGPPADITPPDRTYYILREDRTLYIARENRTYYIPREVRS